MYVCMYVMCRLLARRRQASAGLSTAKRREGPAETNTYAAYARKHACACARATWDMGHGTDCEKHLQNQGVFGKDCFL
jgi:hypothetical protein